MRNKSRIKNNQKLLARGSQSGAGLYQDSRSTLYGGVRLFSALQEMKRTLKTILKHCGSQLRKMVKLGGWVDLQTLIV